MRLANQKEWRELNPLRSWRRGRGLSAVQCAMLLNVSSVTVSFWETGTVRPGAENMAAIAELIELPQFEVEEQWTMWREAAPGREEMLA